MTDAGTATSVVLLLERLTLSPPAGAGAVRVTLPVELKPQSPLEGDITSAASVTADVQ